MSYNRRYTEIGDAIFSELMNKLEENTELVRRQHAGSAEPAELEAGMFWLDDSEIPWILKVYNGNGWATILKLDSDNEEAHAINPDHATGGSVGIDNDWLNVTSVISQGAWRTIGPTGSGADVIWDALDNVPADADWVEVHFTELTVANSSGTAAELKVYAAKGDASPSLTILWQVAWLQQQAGTGTSAGMSTNNRAVIPLDDSNIFQLHWVRISGNSSTITCVLGGYGFNR